MIPQASRLAFCLFCFFVQDAGNAGVLYCLRAYLMGTSTAAGDLVPCEGLRKKWAQRL